MINLYSLNGSIQREAKDSHGEDLKHWSPKALNVALALPCNLQEGIVLLLLFF